MTVLLKFFGAFIRSLGQAYSASERFGNIPVNVDAARKYLLQEHESSFIAYVLCPSCNSIYDYGSCVVMRGSDKESKKCQHVAYPNHPHHSRRKECGHLLLKKVRSGRLVPIKAYPYQPLRHSLGRLVQRK